MTFSLAAVDLSALGHRLDEEAHWGKLLRDLRECREQYRCGVSSVSCLTYVGHVLEDILVLLLSRWEQNGNTLGCVK